VPSVALPGNPGFVTVSPNGTNAYVTTFRRVRQYQVGPGRFLEPMTPRMVWAGSFPSSLRLAQRQGGLASALNGHSIYQLSVAAGGGVSAKTPPSAPGEGNPYDVVALLGT
jgi:hypothetical protein